jgi:uncharacterized protein with GYD domain
MRILLSTLELSTLTGQPIYTYHLAKGLRELGHEVVAVGDTVGGEIKKMFESVGAKVYFQSQRAIWHGYYDLVVLSEAQSAMTLNYIESPNIVQIMHAKHDIEKPMLDLRIKAYLAPRQQIIDHHQITADILPIPIDFERFNVKKVPHDKYRVVSLSTFDGLRTKMFESLAERAKDEMVEVYLVGKDHGGLAGVDTSRFTIKQEISYFEVPNLLAQMDELVSLYEGTVAYEATAMGLKTLIYQENGISEYQDYTDKIKECDYKKVVKKLLTYAI